MFNSLYSFFNFCKTYNDNPPIVGKDRKSIQQLEADNANPHIIIYGRFQRG